MLWLEADSNRPEWPDLSRGTVHGDGGSYERRVTGRAFRFRNDGSSHYAHVNSRASSRFGDMQVTGTWSVLLLLPLNVRLFGPPYHLTPFQHLFEHNTHTPSGCLSNTMDKTTRLKAALSAKEQENEQLKIEIEKLRATISIREFNFARAIISII